MKYMLLIYENEQSLDDEIREDCYDESLQLVDRLRERGQFLSTAPLHPTDAATSIRVRDGKPVITDGPFAETREQLGGFFMVDVENLDEAISIASQIPGARRGTVEVRPVVELAGLKGR